MSDKIFPFLSLPREIRDEIYGMVFSGGIDTKCMWRKEYELYPSLYEFTGIYHLLPIVQYRTVEEYMSDRNWDIRIEYNPYNEYDVRLLRTNRQIYNEAMPILYKSLSLSDYDIDKDWLSCLSSSCTTYIRSLTIDYIPEYIPDITNLLDVRHSNITVVSINVLKLNGIDISSLVNFKYLLPVYKHTLLIAISAIVTLPLIKSIILRNFTKLYLPTSETDIMNFLNKTHSWKYKYHRKNILEFYRENI